MSDNELIFHDQNGHLVVLMGAVVQHLNSYRQIGKSSKEAAGILIGERRGQHLVICDLSEPGPGDLRQRYLVDRRGAHHQKKVDDAFSQSMGTHQYLGEWHTHPEDHPTPSYQDKKSWKDNIDAMMPMIVLIVGRKSFWIGRKEGNMIYPLTLKDLSFPTT
ncbi:peptidase [Kosakonia radicincitans UMEnt01/12]|uniref:CBASS system CD-NTase/cGAS isopeptidase Cap3 n=1 Tax=Kosakonia radicincitans TaxID=283686 RepID=UPI00046131DD|nr:Mov34/MPN/PAD-1 family protein [Kosakonia radicincitans]KDE34186.1 peptidase [Kosakonia radicincitans UMEnt01/12]